MFTKRRTCPESSRKCLLIAGNRCSISPSKSGSVSELHSMVCTPSVNRRSADGISTVIFMVICLPDFYCLDQRPTSCLTLAPFCHSERSEESLLLSSALKRREIPRSARNDNMGEAFPPAPSNLELPTSNL